MVAELELAEALHDKLCKLDHTEQCFWFYETGDNMWSGQAHDSYVDRALLLLSDLPGISAKNVIKVIKAI